MKVLKFGGSSLADATRYMRVLEISTDTHQTEGAAVVLSAPKGVTNALSLLCEQAQSGADYGELFAKLNMTLHGIADDLNASLDNFSYQPLSEFISEKYAQFK
jgi:aspartokinase/homoserine dehydrogenase 1